MADVRMKGFHKRTPVEDAVKIVLKNIKTLPKEKITFEKGLGRVLASDIVAGRDNPPFDRAAMDGYAVRGENTFGASQTNPIYFKVTGEISTGVPSNIKLRDFEAVKIMTGSPLPEGADAVVMFEHLNELDDEIEVLKSVTPGKNISLKGEDVKKGDVLLKTGRVLKPHDIGMLAAIGKTKIDVYRRPRIAVISTGNELVGPSKALKPGKITDINGYSLSALISKYGGVPDRAGIVKDEYKGLENALSSALVNDMVVISGATSVGKKDFIPSIVSKLGEVMFHGVSIRPGEPTGFGVVKKRPVFMLPGYPVAAIVGFETFVRPAMQRMQGMEIRDPYPKIKARLKRKISSELGRRTFVRVRCEEKDGEVCVEPIRTAGSGIVSSLVKADGFVIVPENMEGIEEGEEVEVNVF